VSVVEVVFVMALEAPTSNSAISGGAAFNNVITLWSSFFGEAPAANFCAKLLISAERALTSHGLSEAKLLFRLKVMWLISLLALSGRGFYLVWFFILGNHKALTVVKSPLH
jgi:hypothetical protein